MTEKLCTSQHICECIPENRDTLCQHEDRTDEKFTEQRKLGMFTGYRMKRCNEPATLVDNCHSIFEHKYVYCKKHEEEHVKWYDRKCRMCGTEHRSCCC